MRFPGKLLVAVLPVISAFGIAPVKAETIHRMDTSGVAFPPPAFHPFCAREPDLCSTRGATKAIALTPARMAELKTVNLAVNKRIREEDDRLSAGRADDWRVPVSVGDCEDFAILKKKELMRRGWAPSALLLTVARSGGEGHVVLTVRTDRGDLILDNRSNAVRDWTRVNYRYFARQSQSKNGKWERIAAADPMSAMRTAALDRPIE